MSLNNFNDDIYYNGYSMIYNQLDMITDQVRMDTYYSAIYNNKEIFFDKTVLDIGSGTGILSIWVALNGANKVYSVENSNVSKLTSQIIKLNNLEDKICLLNNKLENIILPEKVDIIISEWMGYMLLNESMIDVIILARDKWLKKNGLILPSEANLYLTPVNSIISDNKFKEINETIIESELILEKTLNNYSIDLSPLYESYKNECWNRLVYDISKPFLINPEEIMGTSEKILSINLYTITINELENINCSLSFKNKDGKINGYIFWFDTVFKKEKEKNFLNEYVLSTSPCNGYTHWKQILLTVREKKSKFNKTDIINIQIIRDKENYRNHHIKLNTTDGNYQYYMY